MIPTLSHLNLLHFPRLFQPLKRLVSEIAVRENARNTSIEATDLFMVVTEATGNRIAVLWVNPENRVYQKIALF